MIANDLDITPSVASKLIALDTSDHFGTSTVKNILPSSWSIALVLCGLNKADYSWALCRALIQLDTSDHFRRSTGKNILPSSWSIASVLCGLYVEFQS